ncbi:MAG: histidine kinase dimerization/phospho-acceptor domain-containing protein, partial [Gemmatimonadales bacterium]
KNTVPSAYEPTTLVYYSGQGASVPALAVGVPLGSFYQLYYVFPFTQQQATLLLVQRILVGVGLAVVVLLAAIASLVTRWVVLPVRHAAQAAQRLSAGHLGERMEVLGVDDLAALATSFNEMAASLEGKLGELGELSNVQRQFVSDVSHELRTPLTAIRGYASSLLQPDVRWDSSSEDRFLVRISEESARLGRLVDDLLDFSAIDAGILRLQPDWCDLRLVLEAARACVPGAGPQQVELRCAPDLPVIWADHDRLEQVFVNLLDNAVRHNPPGTSVVVDAAAAPAGQVAVSVTDDGSCVPEAVVAAGFVARGERRRRGSGAGLGLSIAKGIVDAHGGRMAIDRMAVGTR